MEEEKKKYNHKALLGTIIFHGLILLCFIIFGLTTPLPLPEEEGVVVSLGYTDQGMGQRQPLTSSPPPPQPQQTQAAPAAQDVATQSSEETVSIPSTRQERPQPREEVTRPQPTPPTPQTTQPETKPDPEPQVDPRALFPGRDRQTTTSQNQGETGQPGSAGRPDGSTDGTAAEGGGAGSGPQFSLTGRRANHLPLPEYSSASQGRVVVAISVNRNGEVVRARAGERGTTTNDRVLWAAAEAAALKARFDVKSDAPHEQTGTITYNFIRLN